MIRAHLLTVARNSIVTVLLFAVATFAVVGMTSVVSARIYINLPEPEIASVNKNPHQPYLILAQKKQFNNRRQRKQFNNRSQRKQFNNRSQRKQFNNRSQRKQFNNRRQRKQFNNRRQRKRFENRRRKQSRGFTNRQSNSAVSSGRAASLGNVARRVRQRVPGQLLDARLMKDRRGNLTYKLKILGRNGVMRNVTADAYTGAILGIR